MLATRLPNFTEFHQIKGNLRKVAVTFAICARDYVIKYKKTLAFLFQCAQIAKRVSPLRMSDLEAIGSHIK